MEQHPVPQNVTTFQFRLIGDMTLKQFGYLAAGVIIGYLFYKLPVPFFFSWPLAIGSALTGFGFAFVPIEERPMDVWVLSFIKSIYSPTLYVWQKGRPIAEPAAIIPAPTNISSPAPQAATGIQTPQAMPTAAPITHAPTPPAPTVVIPLFIPPVASQPRPAAAAPPHSVTLPHHPSMPLVADLLRPKGVPQAGKGATARHPGFFEMILDVFRSKPTAPTPTRMQGTTPTRVVSIQTHEPAVTHRATHGPGIFDWIETLFFTKGVTPPAHPAPQKPAGPPLPTYVPILATPSITGNRAEPHEEQPPQTPVPDVPPTQSADAVKVNDLEAKLINLQEELSAKTSSDARILELQKQLTEVLSERHSLQNELISLRQKVSKGQAAQPQQTMRTATMSTPQAAPTITMISPDAARKAGLPRLTSIPNVVTGIIKDQDGMQLPGILVTVKDQTDVPMRALKTNKLGQFAASTPLPSGTYLVEIEDPRGKFLFDRVQITINGSVMPAVEVVAKSMKELNRAKLAQELFGDQKM